MSSTSNTPKKTILWSPSEENQVLLTRETQVVLYDWIPQSSEFKLLASYADSLPIKAIAWSPHTSIHDLVAVGYAGRVDLLRLTLSSHSKISNSAICTLPVRTTKPCTSLAFSSQKPTVLAAGFERTKNEPGLIVWDLGAYSSVLSQASRAHGPTAQNRVGDSTGKDIAAKNQYATAEPVSSVAFLPDSSDILAASVSNTSLRLYDLRVSGQRSQATILTKASGIATDPFKSSLFASFGENTVSVWDSRKMSYPLLSFTSNDASADGGRMTSADAIACIEFSATRRGTLATLTKGGGYVRFWDMKNAPGIDIDHPIEDQRSRESSRDGTRPSKLGRLSWSAPSLPWNASSDQNRAPTYPANGAGSIILANTYHTKTAIKGVASFALVPSTEAHPLTSNIVYVNTEDEIGFLSTHDVPKHILWSSRGDLAIGLGTEYRIFPGFRESVPQPDPWNIPFSSNLNSETKDRRGGKTSRSHSRRVSPEPLGFGRGDKDGFPALNATTKDSASVSARTRRFSPSPLRISPLEYSKVSDAVEGIEAALRDNLLEPAVVRPDGKVLHLGTRHRRGDGTRSVSRNHRKETLHHNVIEKDISMMMRTRTCVGYGVQNYIHNSKVTCRQVPDDCSLSQVWTWLEHSRQLLTFGTSKVHGFDFSFQGVLGIWEGLEVSSSQEFMNTLEGLDLAGASGDPTVFPHSETLASIDIISSLQPPLVSHRIHPSADGFHGNYISALNALNSRKEQDRAMWKPAVHHIAKSPHRRLALALCNWRVGDEEIAKWEKEGKQPQAACWLLFMNQGGRAIDLLMNSKVESHQIMGGTLAALLQTSSSKNQELRDYCHRLIIKTQDPHFRIMLSYLVFNDWSDVLEEQALPLRERVSIALRFLEDRPLSTFLRGLTAECINNGRIDGLVLTGLTRKGLDVIQGYVDTTGDVQTAAILSSLVCPRKFQDARAQRWLEAYRELLDGWKLFYHRCQFDIERGKIVQEGIQAGDTAPVEWVPKQFVIRCNYCSKVVNSERNRESSQRLQSTSCPWCGRALPRCSICLLSVSIVSDTGREGEILKDTIDDALIFCQRCRHGGHAAHIVEWFFGDEGSGHSRRTCAVGGCECYCDDEYDRL